MTARERITAARILAFWLPLASTWLMMSLEGPFLAAVIARLPDPKFNLAAYGVAFSVALLLEAPVIMILSAATALAGDAPSFRKLRSFTYALNGLLTGAMALMLLTPAWRRIAAGWIGLPEPVVELTQVALTILLPWPAAIGYRRLYQGLLIRHGLTRRVAYGTVVRLASMAGVALLLYGVGPVGAPGAWVGAAALTAGVCAEALASRGMARGAVRSVLAKVPPGASAPEPAVAAARPGRAASAGGSPRAAPLTYRRIAAFYWPLALTSVVSLGVHPLVTFFMGRAPYPLESLAVLPVINSLVFIFRSIGLSYQEVGIALLDRGEENRRPVGRFALALALAASAGLALIAFTPLARVWFHDLSGLSPELTGFAVTPTRILALIPALSVLLSLQRAVLVHGRDTAPITRAMSLEVGGIVAVLLLGIHGLALPGATAAAVAFVAGRLAGNALLLPPCARVLRGRRARWADGFSGHASR